MQIENMTRFHTLLVFLVGCVFGVTTVFWVFLGRTLFWELEATQWAISTGVHSAILDYKTGEKHFYSLGGDVPGVSSKELGSIEVVEWPSPADASGSRNWFVSFWAAPLFSCTYEYLSAYNSTMILRLMDESSGIGNGVH